MVRYMRLLKNIRGNLVLISVITMAILIVAAPGPVAHAAPSLNLPSTAVNVIVQNDTSSYFVTTLSIVPSGYDITNATYPGWCIDHLVTMTRNETFPALLYSSLNPPVVGAWSSVQWDMVNYILNSALARATGNLTETQDCIWNFVNNTATYTHTLDTNETAILNDAYANGSGFIPSPGQSVAVIVSPQYVVPGSGPFQDSIIAVPMPQPLSVSAAITGDVAPVGPNTYQMNSGGTAYFTANAEGGNQPYSYTWYVNGTSNTTNQTMPFTEQQTGTYIIYVNATDSSSPPQNATSTNITLNVVAASELSVNTAVTGDATLIGTNTYQMNSGATANFTADVTGGSQPYSYTWYVNGTSNTTNQTMTFTPQQTGTYIIYVNATDSSSPPQSATSTSVVNVIPEYPLLTIVILAALTAPLVIVVRRKKNKA
jgi:hypothetical protein